MIVLRDYYNNQVLATFDEENDAFETMMSIIEEAEYEEFLVQYLNMGATLHYAIRRARDRADYVAEGIYYTEVPYVRGEE